MINAFDTPTSTDHEEHPFAPDLTHGFGGPAMASAPAPSSSEVASYLNSSTSFKGLLKSSRSIGIDGRFEGEIQSDADIVIGREAEVRANIHAGNVIISGKVIGNVNCSTLEIQTNGKVVGNITAGSLLIAMGAVFRGQSLMGNEDDAAELPEAAETAHPSTGSRRSRLSSAASSPTPAGEGEAVAD